MIMDNFSLALAAYGLIAFVSIAWFAVKHHGLHQSEITHPF